MLVSLNDILDYAKIHSCAVGAFNTPNLETIRAVLSGAEKLKTPVIISHAELHESYSPLAIIGPIMVMMAQRAEIPVCVHLDHCETLSYLEKALELGFTGVMYDGSALSYEENVANTQRAVILAKRYGAGVEGEIGRLPAREGGESVNSEPVYTDPEVAWRFSLETGIDALAPSFGTAHGIYKAKPQLDLDRVKRISEKTGLPLVMHGGSGVSEMDFRMAILSGIKKINYYSYMSKAGVDGIRRAILDPRIMAYHEIANVATQEMQKDAERAMCIFMAH